MVRPKSERRRKLRNRPGDIGFAVLVVIVMTAIVAVIAVAVGDSRPRSTEGVRTIDDYTASISYGDTLVLTASCGKNCSHVWLVTLSRDDQLVHVDDERGWSPQHHSGALCGIDCTSKVDMGWLASSVEITERADHVVEVHWPFGWGYRRYHSSE